MVTEEQREQIQILQSFLDQGLMDPEDFEEEKKKILSGGSFEDGDDEEEERTPPPTIQKSTTSTQQHSNTSSNVGQRKHVIQSDSSDSDEEPIIKSTTNRNINNNRPVINKTSASPSSVNRNASTVETVNNRNAATVNKSSNNTASNVSVNKYSSSSSGDEEAIIVSDDTSGTSDREINMLRSAIGGGNKSKILQDSTTTDDDSDDEPIISSKRNATTKSSATSEPASKSVKSSGYKLSLSQEERDLLSSDQIQQLEKLAHLVDSEILSEDEVQSKKETLLRQQRKKLEEEEQNSRKKPSTTSTTTQKPSSGGARKSAITVDEQLQKLKDLLDAGILTEEEYRAKRRQLLPNEGSSDEDSNEDEDEEYSDSDDGLKLKLTPQQRDQLSKLDSLLEQGILEQEEYDEKKRQVMGLKLAQSQPSKIIEKKKEKNSEFGETMDLAIYISNIKATPEKPFKLMYEGETVMYQRDESTSAGKTVIVRGTFPKKPKEDCIVSLLIDMPEANIHTQQNFNLSQHGSFIQIIITQEGNRNNIRIKQQHNDSFDTNQLGDKNEEMSRVYLHYSAVPASENEPFRVWINDMMAHQMTESMTSSQSGVIRGSIPKIKRCNPSTDSHHDVKLKIHIPMLDAEEKSYIVNLTDDGEHVGLFLVKDTIVVRQTKSEKVENSDENSKLLIALPPTSRKK